MAYCTGPDANNLKGRFARKLKVVDVQKKAPRYGLRWLKPDGAALITHGEIKSKAGKRASPLFTLVGELLPANSWRELSDRLSGVYILYDASETARYVGISKNIKKRLGTYFIGSHTIDEKKRAVAVAYSVYAVSTRARAREVESLLIHAMGPQLFLNDRKHRYFAQKPDCQVFEPRTLIVKRRTKYAGVPVNLGDAS
jgi:GIY-YIG catalytic domain-containing protein